MLCANENEGIYAYSNFPSLAAILEEETSFADGGTFFVPHRKCVNEHKCFFFFFSFPFLSSPPPPSFNNYNLLGTSVPRPQIPGCPPHFQDA